MVASSSHDADARLELRGVSKRFRATQAIRRADLRVRRGTVHALVGANGAGKSTLVKIISGAHKPDTGELLIDGESQLLGSTSAAMLAGIETVYQEPHLFEELTVAENLFLGREIVRNRHIDWRATTTAVGQLLSRIGLSEKLSHVTVGDLSIAEQQQVSIAKALGRNARLLLLDEPSAILTDREVETFFRVVRQLVREGESVVYVTHRLDELSRIADEVTVMRDGETVATRHMADLTVREVAHLMVGETVPGGRVERRTAQGPPRLSMRSISSPGCFTDVSLDVAGQEVVALYGLIGSGATEIATAVYGLPATSAGDVVIDDVPLTKPSPRMSRRRGVALLPADRNRQGLFSFQSIEFNISIAHLNALSRWRVGVNRRREQRLGREAVNGFSVKARSADEHVRTLSGGNAQKVLLARQLAQNPGVLVLIEPTQGVDIKAKEEIHRFIEHAALEGAAVLLVTTDVGEAQRLADRILIVRAGTITAEFMPGTSQVDILAAASGDAPARREAS